MDRPLVVTDSSDRAPELIKEAGELADSGGAPLYVLTVISQEEFENDAEVMEKISELEKSNYERQPEEYAEDIAESAINDLLLDYEIETEAIGRVMENTKNESDIILEVAQHYGCDYIFLSGSRRSPTGKAIFGDTLQNIILNFDGYTVTTTQ
jgi:nucleotide-binding universal stress UspA family protein